MELLVVIAVIGGVLALVLARLPDVTGAYLRTDAGKLSTLLRYIDETSATRRTYYRVSFDMDRNRVGVEESADGKSFAASADAAIRSIALSPGVEFESMAAPGRGVVSTGTFAALITPSASGDQLVVHLKGGGELLTVLYNPFSGKVRVEDGLVYQ